LGGLWGCFGRVDGCHLVVGGGERCGVVVVAGSGVGRWWWWLEWESCCYLAASATSWLMLVRESMCFFCFLIEMNYGLSWLSFRLNMAS